jgi:hypothetical protein
MATFSIGEAFGAGFRLVGRKPLTVYGWGLALLVLGALPVLAALAWLAPDFIRLVREAEASSGQADTQAEMARLMAVQSKFIVAQGALFLSDLAARAIVVGAVFRAVLSPDDRRFAYLRLSAKEVWLGLMTVSLSILAVISMLVLFTGLAILGGILYLLLKDAGDAPLVFCMLAGGAAVLIAATWLMVRLSLVLPMTFDEGGFPIAEAWTLTRGQGWKLFGLALAVGLVVVVIALVLQGLILGGFLGALGVQLGEPSKMTSQFERAIANWKTTLLPWILVFAAVAPAIAGAFTAVAYAPFAEAYRQLKASAAGPVA